MNEVDWFLLYCKVEAVNKRLTHALASDYHTQKDLDRAKHMGDLEAKNRKLKETVRRMQLEAERNNEKNYATGLIVRCTGCRAGQPFDGEHLTEERVKIVEELAGRLRRWWNGHKWRLARDAAPPQTGNGDGPR